ncbi:MAG: protease SohB [Hafnia sp.]
MVFLADYASFLLKAFTVVIAVIVVMVSLFALRKRRGKIGSLKVTRLNEFYSKLEGALDDTLLSAEQLKAQKKAKKTSNPQAHQDKRRVFVLDFNGDVAATAVNQMRHEVTALLSKATPQDEVVLRLESGGGTVHGYGLASSHLIRIREAGIPLTVCVDKVAASGGYMMASIANQIISAPFAILGSIGVVSQMPNFNRLLKKHDIDVELITAGDYKRTLTIVGENTDAGRQKYQEELSVVHELFKAHVSKYREVVDIEKVSTGEAWFGLSALDFKLVDRLQTSDEYLCDQAKSSDIIHLAYQDPKKRGMKHALGSAAASIVDRALMTLWTRLSQHKGY